MPGHGTATFGQTVTVPAGDTSLDSFTFYVRLPTGLVFRGEVYAWQATPPSASCLDPSACGHATGTALWESGATQTTCNTPSPPGPPPCNKFGFEPITFNTGGIPVTPGAQYVLFATISKDYAANGPPPTGGKGTGAWGFIPFSNGNPTNSGNAYQAGGLVFLNNGNDTSQWTTTTTWGNEDGIDFAFKASFSSPDNDLALTQPSDLTVDATSPAGAVVTYTNPAASDETHSTVTVNCVPASGSTLAIGDTTVTCTATDTDGDTNSPVQQTFNVHVKDAAEQLTDLATAVTGVGTGTSLADKVASAQSYLAADDTADACGTLNALINQVHAQTPKKIPPDVAEQLISATQQIEAVIPCTS
jgi:hypothetical protein